MQAMVLKKISKIQANKRPLDLVQLPRPVPGTDEILVKISTCGVCHTELDEIEGRTPPPHLPMILGHQVIGHVVQTGVDAKQFKIGDRVGIAWIYSACGRCVHCSSGYENLCEKFRATGRDAFGGYAEYTTVPDSFAHHIPEAFMDAEAAPLLCAGAIGYRSMHLAGLKNFMGNIYNRNGLINHYLYGNSSMAKSREGSSNCSKLLL